jgi:O-antigen/teichoic acid export membrane protein
LNPPPRPPATQAPGRLARNTALNLVAILAPLVLGFALLPVVARHLGPARFGLLGLSWTVLEYFALFDVGLGRATTKFVAGGLALGRRDTRDVLVLSVLTQAAFGVLGGALLFAGSGALADRVLDVDAALRGEAISTLRAVALSLPVLLVSGALRGALEAANRFDLSAAVRVPSSVATYAIPALAAPAGLGVGTILLLVLVARVATVGVLAAAVGRAVPGDAWRLPRDWRALRPLLSFGGWVTVSNVVNPVLVSLDRLMLGAAAGVAAIGYYTAPYELVSRLLLVAGAAAGALFPTVTALGTADDAAALRRLFGQSVRNLLLVIAPVVLAVAVFAPEILRAWLGADYAARSATPLRLLAFGVLVNALAFVPFSYLQALHRPDLTAKFHVAELVVHVPLTWVLVSAYGVAGAAGAWTFRVTLDAVLLFVAARRTARVSPFHGFAGRAAAAAGALAVLCGAVVITAALVRAAPALRVAILAAGTLAFAALVWSRVMDGAERGALAALVRRPRRRGAAS